MTAYYVPSAEEHGRVGTDDASCITRLCRACQRRERWLDDGGRGSLVLEVAMDEWCILR